RCVNVGNLDGTDVGVGPTLGRRSLCRTLEETTAHSPGVNPPVGDGETFHARELPAEHLAIKRDDGVGLSRLNLEVCNGVHGCLRCRTESSAAGPADKALYHE